MTKVSKNDRLMFLRELIANNELGSQEEVVRLMNKCGVATTQATLSRDMRALKIVKMPGRGGKSVYAVPMESEYKRVRKAERPDNIFPAPGFLSIQFSGNVAVIHTRPGFASSIASSIDEAALDDVIGTIAGDDTIFIVIRDGARYVDVTEKLQEILPDMVM